MTRHQLRTELTGIHRAVQNLSIEPIRQAPDGVSLRPLGLIGDIHRVLDVDTARPSTETVHEMRRVYRSASEFCRDIAPFSREKVLGSATFLDVAEYQKRLFGFLKLIHPRPPLLKRLGKQAKKFQPLIKIAAEIEMRMDIYRFQELLPGKEQEPSGWGFIEEAYVRLRYAYFLTTIPEQTTAQEITETIQDLQGYAAIRFVPLKGIYLVNLPPWSQEWFP